MDWLSLISACASVATAVGVFLAGRQITLAKRQAKTQFEDDLTRQYREIIKEIPTDALLGKEISDDEYQKARHAFYRYIDLSNEQIFLSQKGRVSKETTKMWCDGIQSHLSKPAFERAWKEFADEKTHQDFRELRTLKKPLSEVNSKDEQKRLHE
jgi:hypothetical protein